MSEPADTERDDVTAFHIMALERACDRYEAAWGAGLRPSIEEYLTDPGSPDDPTWLRELLVLELAYRRRAGDWPTLDEYRARFPGSPGTVEAAFGDVAARDGTGEDESPAGPHAGSIPSIPGYTVLEELGRGGMGVVFKALPERLGRLVALKMILAGELAGPEATTRFLAEAEAVARLQHPQVVQIFRIGDHNGRPYLEMEFVEGGSLADRLDGTPWRPVEAARLVESLARAVHHAHRRGIVHRDLKPANILLTADGVPKITDFGLAKSLGKDQALTRTDSIIGSPSYMAPEQAGGALRRVGASTDVYALGAILYELLTGRPPFRAATVLATLEQVKSAEPALPSRLQPGLPVDIETIALKCLQKDAARRYLTAEALADDLARFGAGEPITARPVGVVERGIKWARRRPLTATLALASAVSTVLLILVLAVTIVIVRQQQRQTLDALNREHWIKEELARTNDRLADQQKQTETALRRTTVALEARTDDLQRERLASYFERIALAESEQWAGRADHADQVLEECPADLRGWEWRFLKRSAPQGPRAFLGHTGEVWDASISPDGRTLASASFDKTIKLWDVATGQLKRTLRGHVERAYSVAFDRQGTRLVSASADRTAIVWELPGGQVVHVLRGHIENVRCASFSPDGGRIASGSWDGTLRTWDARTGQPLDVYPTGAGWITRIAFSPDGRWISVGGSSGRAEVWEWATGRRLRTFAGHSAPVLSVAFSPDGGRVASTSNVAGAGAGVVKVWEVSTGRVTLSLKVGPGSIERVAFSPDGQRLATSGWDGTVRLWDVATGREVLRLRGHNDRVWGTSFSPSGDSLVSAGADGKVLLWDASDRGRPSTAE